MEPESTDTADSGTAPSIVPGDGQLQPQCPYLKGFQLYNVITALLLAMLLTGLDVNIVATAVPTISNQFNSFKDVNWYGSAFLLAICAMQPLSGKIYSLFISKHVFMGFMALFELGTLICALANSSKMIIAGRAVTGLGGAGIFNGALVISTTLAPPNIRPMLTSIGVSMLPIGGFLGPIIGGALSEHAIWRWCKLNGYSYILNKRDEANLTPFPGFWAFLPPGAFVMLAILLLRIPESAPKPLVRSTLAKLPQKLDLIGFTLFAPPCIMFLIAISWGGVTYPWDSSKVIGLLCGSVVMLSLFTVWCLYRGEEALIPKSLIRQRTVLVASCVSGLQGGASIMVGYFLPLWFQAVKGATPTNSGLMMLPTMASQIVGSMLSGALIRKLHYLPPWAILGSIFAAVGPGLMVTFNFNTPRAQWIGYQVLGGVGRGMALNMSVIQNRLPAALEKYTPDTDIRAIVRAGATEFIKTVPPDQLLPIKIAYNEALVKIFYIPAASAAAAIFVSIAFSWRKLGTEDAKGSESSRA
ncbi:Major Facilitator Superfamily protein [Coccidioides posadasii C735 delta SOWgp]|uniref:Major Facilitator Superfamily protein n=1 Tax=Coccidioides posadasii (strain C735) TaxID=222929 RepID=C5P0C8_COCP7|nr:Major Facilitator Superfamily protein [Coccidioides posadasii C735 delta SOWgp]EER29136.1 Major Facilitator Superfamily protein [Coccidioides posadasii C735 delta SOWgp]|eukprot:XP_003071281.1 Major Facilitator Superfamily protein [Coccidioides posadasii C735 delta SOWgp]